MALGSYLGMVFTVSNRRILTPSGLKGSTGGEWAVHDVVGRKSRSQFVAPKLKSYQFDILLRAQDGVNPRSTLRHFQMAAENGYADWFIIGSAPLSPYPFKLVSVSDSWDAVISGGALVECKVSLNIEEYL